MKQAMIQSVNEVCGSVKVGEKNPESIWWNDEVKAVVGRKEATWKEVLTASDKEAKEDVWKLTNKKRERLKGAYSRAKRK